MARVHLDTSIFERTHTREEARRARKLENLYHAGQHKIWDGREVLAGLVAKHGGVHMKTAQKQALARVFSSLMWGELAAWKISAQLADRLHGYEARLAATSQAHDEARHFYVLHDYLELLELELPALDPATRYLLETVLGTDVLTEKLVGMQLFVETMALTMFKTVRELAVEPVLTELLSYFERDEARHVGLGIQHVPDLIVHMSKSELARLAAFETRVLLASLVSLKRMEPSLRTMGVDPRKVSDAGTQMLLDLVEKVREANDGVAVFGLSTVVSRSFFATQELMFPRGEVHGLSSRLYSAGMAFLTDAA